MYIEFGSLILMLFIAFAGGFLAFLALLVLMLTKADSARRFSGYD